MSAKQYKKKPVVIEAFKYDGTLKSAQEIVIWSGGKVNSLYSQSTGKYLTIDTLEGEMMANPGDYIIKGIMGEYYPCKSDIFEATYEVSEE